MYNDILLSVENKVGTITINRPDYMNALSRPTYGEIKNAMEEFNSNDNVNVIVITGTGKHFSAGGDIQRFRTLIENQEYLSEEGIAYAGEMTTTIRRSSKPVIAMVNGVATGAGLSIALACDYRVVTPKSKLIMAFVKLGLPGDTGSLYFLPKLVGIPKASEIMMTGDPINGEEAYKIGLATHLTSDENLSKLTYDFAQKLTQLPLKAVAKQKEIINKYFYPDLDEYSIDEKKVMAECSRNNDFKEAVYAFLEKRHPEFNK